MDMDDVLERLREESLRLARNSFDSVDAGLAANVADAAIDEIERLRDALQSYSQAENNEIAGHLQPRGEPVQTNATQPTGSPNLAAQPANSGQPYVYGINCGCVRGGFPLGSCAKCDASSPPKVSDVRQAVAKLREIADFNTDNRFGRLALEAIADIEASLPREDHDNG